MIDEKIMNAYMDMMATGTAMIELTEDDITNVSEWRLETKDKEDD